VNRKATASLSRRIAINMAGFKTLNEGDRVSFDVGQGQKGPAAENVTKL
jgi:CspA family cold shock protein